MQSSTKVGKEQAKGFVNGRYILESIIALYKKVEHEKEANQYFYFLEIILVMIMLVYNGISSFYFLQIMDLHSLYILFTDSIWEYQG